MHRLRFQITTISPILITSNVGDPNMVSTAEYIPGSSILGVFANKFAREKEFKNKEQHVDEEPHDDKEFQSWFLDGRLVFTNAYIVSFCESGLETVTKGNYPLPFSVQYEKGNDSSHYDLLLYEDDTDQTVSEKGYGRLAGSNLYREKVKKSINFHHQRDPETGTSKEGLVFNYESIDNGQTFKGNILGCEEDLKEFKKRLFKEAQDTMDIYLGRSKNTQYGRARFEMISKQPEEYTGEIETGSDDNELTIEGDKIALTMLSDTIIYNEYGFPTTEKKYLLDILKKEIDNNNLTITKSFLKTGKVENFVSVWRLRRPSETCFLAGSCFLIEGISDNESKKLKEIQKNGIGERRGEGFGRVVFGWQNQDSELEMQDSHKINMPEPTCAIPAMTTDIIKNIIRPYLKKEIELKALDDVKEFKNLPTGHLIGRLESAIKDRNDKDKFVDFVKKLKGKASSQLERCRNGDNEMLYQFLTDRKSFDNVTIEGILKNRSIYPTEVGDLAGKVKYDVVNDKGLEVELYYNYFITFFSAMRKRKKMQI